MLKTTNLAIGRGSRVFLRFTDFELRSGEQCLVSGKSGCGKSTLLLTLAGLLPPIRGEVMLEEKVVHALPESERDVLRGVKIGFVFQALHLMPLLSVEDNLKLVFYSAGLPVPQARIDEVLERLHLSRLRDRMPHSLSQGQAQRVSIARAVVHLPKLILADEPTSSLDDENCDAIMALIQEMAKEAGAALIVSTHDSRITRHFTRRLALVGADA